MARRFTYDWVDVEDRMPPMSSIDDDRSIMVKLRILCKPGSLRYDYGYYRKSTGEWHTRKTDRIIRAKVIGWYSDY